MTEFLTQTIWVVPIYSWIGAFLTIPWATGIVRRTGPRPAAYFNLLMTLFACIHGWLIFQASLQEAVQEIQFHWLMVADIDISFVLEVSPVSTAAMEFITSLSLLAQLYALGYMEKDWGLARFFALMGFFEGALIGIVLSNSLFLTYALLEMLTLCTLLIVGFWYAQPLALKAARDAFLTKRVGDILLLIGVVSLATFAGSLTFSDLYTWAYSANLPPLVGNLLGLALIAGPIGKCAQFPLNLWLDEAMEGPNPASVLRNSLVVTCGTYVLIKLVPIVTMISPLTLSVLVVIGTITALGTSMVAIAQIDIKRSLSHSTSAYIGLVFIAVGMQRSDIGVILLVAHAFAKALMFMSIGGVILNTNNQNLAEMGGLGSKMPATSTAFAVGIVGLIGLFPLGGFWAMSEGINAFWFDAPLLVIPFLFVNAVTALGLVRVFRLVFLGKPQAKTRRAPEVPWAMALPMVALTILTLLVPVLMRPMELLSEWEYLNPLAEVTLVISGVVGCTAGALIYLPRTWSRSIRMPLKLFQDLFAYDFYLDELYRYTIVFAVLLFSNITAWIDRYIVDGLVNLVGLGTVFSGQGLKYSVSGKSQFYVLTILLGISLLAIFITWPLNQWSLSQWSLEQWSLFIGH
ncbi:NAD(P)H-quinone oxidoreductase subunit F [Moorena sp. SIO3B2]|uniref:NAD(P)H-quinone oxidoreductase subunit F n=1 Tax=Moorena sp. SIO3B2 TaxID=2607827 RepID=UPI0013CDC70D|nr:NAD(P)H-quinone oxidoreductase subunit F [Moorena sp. SIO3B2]NEP30534.1 NAD(P)H-quinone oxidoreductase subunit F [Moorena sp. SIO3B2]